MLHDVQSMLIMVEVSVHGYDHNSCRDKFAEKHLSLSARVLPLGFWGF